MSTIDMVLCLALAITMVIAGIFSVFACLDQDYGQAVYFLVSACGCGLLLWVFTAPKSDPCILAEQASDEVLKENMVVGEIKPVDWQLLESCLRGLWNPLNLERNMERINDIEYLEGYHDGQLNGYALAVQQIAKAFDIDLEENS